MTPKRKLQKIADRLWFEKYQKESCEACGSSKYLQVHHFYYKGNYSHLRYDNENAITLCRKCHFILHHQDPKRVEDIIIEKRGQRWLNRLKKKAYKRPEPSYQTLDYYKKIIKQLS